jgi:hypothetical protein
MINASRYNAFWMVLFALGSAAACSSSGDGGDDNNNNNNGKSGSSTGGNLNTGGNQGSGGSGTAGSGTSGSSTSGSGTGGSGTSGSGSGGSGGGSTACAGMKPAGSLVTEFMDLMPNATSAGNFSFQAGVPGGTFSYQPAVFTLTDATGALNVKGNVKAYDGFGVYFGACTDASAYTGVSFDIKGNAGPTGKLSFRFQTNANTAVDPVNKKGTCVVPAGTADPYPLCHHATFDITVAPEGGNVAVKFSDVTGGVPVATVDGKDLVGLEWAFPWAGAGDTAYDVDVTVDNIKFTGGASGGSGGGGAGGGSAGGGGAGGGGAGGGGAGGQQQ